MKKERLVFMSLAIFMVSLTGCVSARKQNFEIQGLRNQVSVLEAQIQSKDEELGSLRDSLSKALEEKETLTARAGRKKYIAEVKSRPNTKQIQIALRNAGFNPGPIDGGMGRQTREAIRAFQRANNLAADGKVGRQTWGLLKEYLYKKVK